MSNDVFISYRGADRALARRLAEQLSRRWGCEAFLDERGLNEGANWQDQLHENLRRSLVMMALIGPGWQLHADTANVDWVRDELEQAVALGKPVLPVLVGVRDELRPKLEQLPEAFGLQAVSVSEKLTTADVRHIASVLDRLGASTTAERRIDVRSSPAARQLTHTEALGALAEGRHVLIEGAPGSGRSDVVTAVARSLWLGEGVAAHRVAGGLRTRRTVQAPYGLVAAWFLDMFGRMRDSGRDRDPAVVNHVLEVTLDPELFAFDDDDRPVVLVTEPGTPALQLGARQAAEVCPSGAITIDG